MSSWRSLRIDWQSFVLALPMIQRPTLDQSACCCLSICIIDRINCSPCLFIKESQQEVFTWVAVHWWLNFNQSWAAMSFKKKYFIHRIDRMTVNELLSTTKSQICAFVGSISVQTYSAPSGEKLSSPVSFIFFKFACITFWESNFNDQNDWI